MNEDVKNRISNEELIAENALRASEEKYRLITENISDVVSVFNFTKNRFTYISPSIEGLRGLTVSEAMNESLKDSLTPESFEIMNAAISRNMEDFLHNPMTLNHYITEVQQPCKPGEIIWVEIATKYRYNSESELETIDVSRNIDKRKSAEKMLHQSEERYKFLFEHSGVAVGFYKTDGTIITFNQKAAANMGGRSEEYAGRSIYDLFPKMAADFYMGRIAKASIIDTTEEYIDFVPLAPGDKWLSSTIKRIIDQKGDVIGVQIISLDITARVKAEKALKASEERYQLLFVKSMNAFALHDIICDEQGIAIDYRFLAINPAFEQMTGLKAEDIINRTVLELMPKTEAYWIQTYGRVALTGESITFENYSAELNKHFEVSAYQPAQNQFACVFADVTERKKAEAIMTHLSYHDQLTDLYNRRFYEEELKRLDTERNLPITLIMADVNGLKLTNDVFGHQAGDILLQTIAQILKKVCRADEIISRIGGDEFVILMPKSEALQARLLIDRIAAAILKEKKINPTLSLSMGYSVKEKTTQNMDVIFKEAENDMYHHKLADNPGRQK